MGNIEAVFVSAEKADITNVLHDSEELNGTIKLAENVINEMPSSLMVLNDYLQVVFTNQAMIDLLGISSEEILGKKLGEIINCIHVYECKSGYGTAECCSECGAFKTVLAAHENDAREETDLRITTTEGDSRDYKIWALPYCHNNKDYTVVSLMDIADTKRRQALEHTFLYDMNNTLSIISNYSQLIIEEEKPDKTAYYAEMVNVAAQNLINEIESQRNLTKAENRELPVELSLINSMDILDEITLYFSEYGEWQDRIILIGRHAEEFNICTDRSLLTRVLFNMVKNALEATSDDEKVFLTCMENDGLCVFSVNNPNFMPSSVQFQVFQRSFSTKGTGRGIGTYIMKLFGEKYLNGNVWFTSSEDEGTTFNISMDVNYSDVCNSLSMAEPSLSKH